MKSARKSKTQLYQAVIQYFKDNVPIAESELNFSNPYQLIVAVVLSAQCTDKRVNLTTPALFQAYPSPSELALAEFEDLFEIIKSISYPRSKAEHLIDMAKILVAEHNGEIPQDRGALLKLPGVGQKTANVVSSILWSEPVIAVDTHVFRVARRIGLSQGKNPLEVEKDLEANIPAELRPKAHHWLILHGRYICKAKKPDCENCGLSEICYERLFARSANPLDY